MPSRPGNPAASRPGKRQENKQDKLARIVAAARQVFAEKGFETATVQEIARQARVATGTIFLYADTKRDIAFLTVLADYEAAMAEAQAVPVDLPLTPQLMACFAPYLRFNHAQPELAKVVLSELLFFTTGKHAAHHGGRVNLLKQELARRFVIAQARGEVVPDAAADDMAELAYVIFQGEGRAWVRSGAADLAEGMDRLHRILALGLTGVLRPAP